MKRNVIGGLVMTCVGGMFLAISGFNLILSGSYAHDIDQEFCDFSGCKPLEQIAMESAIGSAIIGAFVTSAGLFFFIYGIKHQHSRQASEKSA